MNVRLVLLSDTHGQHRRVPVPSGDVFIHAGDLLLFGDTHLLDDFNAWLGELPHRYKLVIAGNHDFYFAKEQAASAARLTNACYLQDQAVTLSGLNFYGSPWQPWFGDLAFNLPRGEALRKKWELIPADTQVLITHTPPFGQGDRTWDGEHVGCRDLQEAVTRVQPRLHVFGHIHEAAGSSVQGGTTFVNASVCDDEYQWVRTPVVFDYEIPEPVGPAGS